MTCWSWRRICSNDPSYSCRIVRASLSGLYPPPDTRTIRRTGNGVAPSVAIAFTRNVPPIESPITSTPPGYRLGSLKAMTSKNLAAGNPVTGLGATPNVFKDNPGKGLITRTFTDKLTIGSGADQINLHHFGPAHTAGDAFVEFPALRVMHAGDAFPNKGLPIMDKSNGGSGVEYANTIMKAVKGVPNVDLIINGHTPAQTTPADMRQFGEFVAEFIATAQAGKKAGKTADQVAKEWATPAKYTGFAAAPPFERVRAYVQVIFDETK